MRYFEGFPAETLAFLRALAEHNSTAWFKEHRSEYERFWKAPAAAFVEAAGPELRTLVPEIKASPRVGGSIMRIGRDSPDDERPYKDHVDLWFWQGDRRSAITGFFLRIMPDLIGIGAGAQDLRGEHLERYRRMVTDERVGARLLDAVATAEDAGWMIEGGSLPAAPRGYESVTGRPAQLVRHEALWVAHFETIPDEFGSDAFVRWCMKHWQTAAPVHRWLAEHVQL